MERFYRWLDEGVSDKRLPGFIFKVFMVELCYQILIILIFQYLELIPPPKPLPFVISWELPFVIFCFAGIEEVIFRYIPIVQFKRGGLPTNTIFIFTLLFSFIFGICHGLTLFNVLAQGVGGAIYSIAFMKCCAGENMEETFFGFRALFVTTLLHSMFNFSLIIFAMIFSIF